MTIEELSKKNDELTARLAKAIQVFNSQKAEITRLEGGLKTMEEHNKILKEKCQEIDKNDALFMKQEEEINQLSEKCNNLTAQLEKAEKKMTEFQSCNGQIYDELQEISKKIGVMSNKIRTTNPID